MDRDIIVRRTVSESTGKTPQGERHSYPLTHKTEDYPINPVGTRVIINATGEFNVYELGEGDTEVALLGSPNKVYDKKVYGTDAIRVEPAKGVKYEVLTISTCVELDKTPVEVPVEVPVNSVTQFRMELAAAMAAKAQREKKMSFEEFADLTFDEGENVIPEGVTTYEATAEALSQHHSPFRGVQYTEEEVQAMEAKVDEVEEVVLDKEVKEPNTE
jgi:hypothetical protein